MVTSDKNLKVSSTILRSSSWQAHLRGACPLSCKGPPSLHSPFPIRLCHFRTRGSVKELHRRRFWVDLRAGPEEHTRHAYGEAYVLLQHNRLAEPRSTEEHDGRVPDQCSEYESESRALLNERKRRIHSRSSWATHKKVGDKLAGPGTHNSPSIKRQSWRS